MSEICRFCLTINTEGMCKLSEEYHIVRKIRSCFTMQIHLNDLFPNHICKECTRKIEDFHTFHETVVLNEQNLNKLLDNGVEVLEDFYKQLKSDIYLKNGTKLNDTEKRLNEDLDNRRTLILCNEIDVISNDQTNLPEPNDIQEITRPKQCQQALQCHQIFVADVKEEDTLKDDQTPADMDTFDHDSDISDNNATFLKENCKVDVEKLVKHKSVNKNNSTPLNNTITDASTCLTCFKVLESQVDLIKHYNKEHYHKNNVPDKSKYTLKKTGKNLKYFCNGCDQSFSKKKDVLKHITNHNYNRPFICKICGRTYRTVTEIVSHKRAHTNYKLECSYQCGFTTAYKGALKDHERRHLEDYKYKCGECGKGFFVKTWFEQHQNVHSGVKPFVCDLCGLAFHMERYLTSHRSTVHPQTSNLKRYVCVHCGHPCDTTKSLAEHLKDHGIKTEFLCDECGKTFKNADKLRNHKYTHLQIKPFTCNICSKSFAKKFTLRVHESAHSGERRHACARCGKRYVQKSTLDRHYRKHHAGSPTAKVQRNDTSSS